MAGFAFPGGFNTYIPTLEHSGNLQVAFSRNTNDFPVNKIARITPVTKMRGQYLYFDPLSIARIPGGVTNNLTWAPGTLAPTNFHNNLGFKNEEFTCIRYAPNTTLDNLGIEQAEGWDVVKSHTEMLAQQAMSNRALKVATVLTTSGNYASTHTVASGTASGGGASLLTGTASNPILKKALDAGAQIIQVDTMGRIRYKDLTIVMNPVTAVALSQSAEIHNYLAQSPDALAQIRGLVPGQNKIYGLPDQLYGFRLIVEDTVYNDDNRLASGAAGAYVFPNYKIVLCVREQDLESAEGAASYSAVHLFIKDDMLVESDVNQWNKLTFLRVVDTFDAKFVAPVSAYLINAINT